MSALDNIEQWIHYVVSCLGHKTQTVDVFTELHRFADSALALSISPNFVQICCFFIQLLFYDVHFDLHGSVVFTFLLALDELSLQLILRLV
jgi:hypothetical protein